MIDALTSFHFERPLWLLCLIPAVALWWLERRFTDPADKWRRIIDPELLRHLLVGNEGASRITPNGLLFAGWILGSIAIAGPVWQRRPSPFADAPPPVVVVLKVATSMTATDLAPTRLDRARQKLSDLLALREGAATGLIAYAGSTHLVLPPTADSHVVLTMAEALAPDVMPEPGDDLAAALVEADHVLAGEPRGGSILVLADAVAGEEIGQIAAHDAGLAHEVTLLALVPPDESPGALEDAARSIGGELVRTTIDSSDVISIARRLDRVGRIGDVSGEGQQWEQEGYWLTPVLAILAFGWFRRGWVLR
jgi:Ca-activated chloride channel family protein